MHSLFFYLYKNLLHKADNNSCMYTNHSHSNNMISDLSDSRCKMLDTFPDLSDWFFHRQK